MSIDNMKKVAINGKMCDVVTLEEYSKNKDLYLAGTTLIETDNEFSTKKLLPILNQHDTKSYGIRVKPGSAFAYINSDCTPEEETIYDPEQIIDLSQASSIGELMEKQDMIKDIEREIITSPDNITTPEITNDDEPAMKLLKTAVMKKNIDLDKYSHRFGSNYNNDKRSLFKQRISLQMLERMCTNLDLKATLTIEDSSNDVINPIGEAISIELTRGKDVED